MASFDTFWAGLLSFFIFAMVGIFLTFIVGGMVLDPVYTAGKDLPHGDEATYQKMQAPLPWFMNLYYFIGVGASVLGGIIFGQSIVKRVRQDQYSYR